MRLKGGYNRMVRNKKGQVLNAVNGLVIGIMVLIFTIFAVLFGISKLNPSSFFTAGSGEANATSYLQANLTNGVASFGTYIPTILIMLGVVLAISGVVILIVYVRKMGGTGGGL